MNLSNTLSFWENYSGNPALWTIFHMFSWSVESLNNYAIIVLKPHLLGITATSGYTDTSSGLVMKLPAVALVTTSSEG